MYNTQNDKNMIFKNASDTDMILNVYSVSQLTMFFMDQITFFKINKNMIIHIPAQNVIALRQNCYQNSK